MDAAEHQVAEDHPFALVAFASVNRLRERARSLSEGLGIPEAAESWIANGFVGDPSMGKLFNSPAFDPTRPIGLMSFPQWLRGDGKQQNPKEWISSAMKSFAKSSDDPFEILVNRAFDNSYIVYCLPTNSWEDIAALVAELSKDEFVPIPGDTKWKGLAKDKTVRAIHVGRYFYLVATNSIAEPDWNLKLPDFERLAKSSLGKNGLTYSLYRRGLPSVVRESLFDAIKLVHEAGYQRQDNETDVSFKLRTMFGPLATEVLDVVLSHIDEFRIAGHVDDRTRQTNVDVELIGPKNGKLAKLTNNLKGKMSLASFNAVDDAMFALDLSLPLDRKYFEPVA
ncbi:MAG: hypothetical protein FJ267_20135, partial [Planctomycetes bacterium]|nr:hypothetical protein [Planctomycetota bacterium]